jgi:cell wall assembly regulator SMI1
MDLNEQIKYWFEKLDDIKKRAHEIDPAEDYIPPNPPATAEEIQKVEEHWGIVFPGDYKNLLMICNGWENMIASIDLLSTDQMLNKDSDHMRAIRTSLEIEIEDGPVTDGVDFRRVIPIGASLVGTDILVIHPVKGTMNFEVIWWDSWSGVVERENDIVAFLERCYKILENTFPEKRN